MNTAQLINIPILKAGNYKGLEIQSNDLQMMANNANTCKGFLRTLAENDTTFPSYINFNHSDILPETIKNLTQNVTPLFDVLDIEGEPWLVASLKEVPADIADTIIKHFPYRSVEIIHLLHNAIDGNDYEKVIRSIGFLDKHTPPAVKGQNDQLSVVYNQEEYNTLVTVLLSEYHVEKTEDTTLSEEKKIMAEDQVQVKNEDIMKLVEERVEERSKQIHEDYEKRAALLDEEKTVLQARIQENDRKTHESQIAMFMDSLEAKQHLTPAAVEVVKMILDPIDFQTVTMLAEKEVNPLEAIKDGIVKLAEMAGKGTLLLNEEKITTPGAQKEPGSLQEQRSDAIAMFMDKADGEYSTAWRLAAHSEETKHLFEPGPSKS